MKGKVFIGWSSDNSLALKVKAELKKSGYNGVVGGKAESSLEHGVGDTIIKQMRSCSAAIMLFTSRPDLRSVCNKCGKTLGGKILSGNMLFELGFLTGSLKPNRVFIVYMDDAAKCAPSDLKGAWDLQITKGCKTEEELAAEIVELFLKEQANGLVEAKIDLVADYSRLKNLIADHIVSPVYYENEMSQIIMMYSRAAYLNDNCASAADYLDEVLHSDIDDDEGMLLAINSALVYLKAICELEKDDDGKVCLPYKLYKKYSNDLKSYLEDADSLPKGDGCRLMLEMTVRSTLCFLDMTYYANMEDDETEFELQEEDCLGAIDAALEFERADEERNELFGVLYESYAYRNLALLYKRYRRFEEAEDAFEKSRAARYKILKYYRNRDLDKTILSKAQSEYYLSLTDNIDMVDEGERKKRLRELKDYIEEEKELSYNRAYLVRKIEKILTAERAKKEE